MLPSRFALAINADTAAIASSVEGFGFFVLAILSLILIYLVTLLRIGATVLL